MGRNLVLFSEAQLPEAASRSCCTFFCSEGNVLRQGCILLCREVFSNATNGPWSWALGLLPRMTFVASCTIAVDMLRINP